MLAVVGHGGSDVPSLCVVGRPAASSFKGPFVDENFHAWWGEGSEGVAERTVELRIGGKLWIHAGGSQEVECDFALGEKFVPEIEGEIRVSAAETGDEVVFKGLDGSFS